MNAASEVFTAIPLAYDDLQMPLLLSNDEDRESQESTPINNNSSKQASSLAWSQLMLGSLVGIVAAFAGLAYLDSTESDRLHHPQHDTTTTTTTTTTWMGALVFAMAWSYTTSFLAYAVYTTTLRAAAVATQNDEDSKSPCTDASSSREHLFVLGTFVSFCTVCIVHDAIVGILSVATLSVTALAAMAWTLLMMKCGGRRWQIRPTASNTCPGTLTTVQIA